MTQPTAELAKIILLDSASIQEEEAEAANKYGYSKHHPAKPLYTEADVIECMKLFTTIRENVWFDLFDDIKVRYKPNGHILGSCSVDIDLDGHHYVFSGDVGRQNPLVVHVPEVIENADYLILESTYGNRLHTKESVALQMKNIILETYERGGHLIIPSFAVERAQEIIYVINQLKHENAIPDIPVFLDSPMAIDASEIMCRYPEWHALPLRACMNMFENISMIRDASRSAQNITNPQQKIIIAGSGMLTGGRVLDYLAEYIEDSKHTVLLTGFQAEGTRGRDLIDKAETIKIHGKYYRIQAQVKVLNGLSGHADQEELLTWLEGLKSAPRKIFLNHGETNASAVLAEKIKERFNWNVEIGIMHQVYELK